MSKKIFGVVLSFLVLIGTIFLFIVFFSYGEQDSTGFPIPKSAELAKSNESTAAYDWPKASEENGIPYFYKLAIQSKGWTLVGQEGASSYYEKDGRRIDLITQTDLLTIRLEK